MPDAPSPLLAIVLEAQTLAHQVARELAPGSVTVGTTTYADAVITYGKGESKDLHGNYVDVLMARVEIPKASRASAPPSNGCIKIAGEDYQVTSVAGHEVCMNNWVIEASRRV